jgi:hypothetical protein
MQCKPSFSLSKARFVILTAALVLLVPATNLMACMMGGAMGGMDYYTPQRQGPNMQQTMPQGQGLSPAQAKQIVIRYIRPINPDLIVGEPNDTGASFEIDLRSKDGEIVQVIAVDKYSGRLQPLS